MSKLGVETKSNVQKELNIILQEEGRSTLADAIKIWKK